MVGMNTPLLLPAICFALGVLCGDSFAVPITLVFVAAFLIAGMNVCLKSHRQQLLLPLCFLVGWVNLASRTQVVSPLDIRNVVGPDEQLCHVSATLLTEPIVRIDEQGETNRWRALLEVESIRTEQEILPTVGRIFVFTPGVAPRSMNGGSQVEVFGVLSQPRTAAAMGLFDYRETLRREGIHYRLETTGAADWRIVESSERVRFGARVREWMKNHFVEANDRETESLRLLWAMFLGWRSGLTEDHSETFKRSGTMHVFAISGLHIGLITTILIALLRTVRVPRAVCGAIVAVLLVAYCAVTDWQTSSIRATVMTCVVMFGWAVHRPFNLLNSTAVAALLILFWDPLQLMRVGFQLSFSVVISISLLHPHIQAMRDRLFPSDPFLPEELVSRWDAWRLKSCRYVFVLFAISFSAWLGSMPLIAKQFNLLTPGSLIANPLAVLCAAGAVASAIGAALTMGWFPVLGSCFTHGACFWVNCQTKVSETVSELPGAWWNVAAPTAWGMGLYYLALVSATSRRMREHIRRSRWAQVGIGVAVTCWVSTWFTGPNAQIAVLGQTSNSIYCDLPGSNDDVMIDSGRRPGFFRIIDRYLRFRGVNHLPTVVLSHGDIRHVETYPDLSERWPIRRTVLSKVSQISPAYRKIEESLFDSTKLQRVSTGESVERWQVLHPPDQTFARADDASIVLAANVDGWRVMIAPDLGEIGQSELVSSGQDLNADVLITGQPTKGQALGYELVHAVSPSLIIVHDDQFPLDDRAGPELRKRLRRYQVKAVFTSDASSVHLEFYGTELLAKDATGRILARVEN